MRPVTRRRLLEEALEDCRIEIARRLHARGLPLTLKARQMVINDSPEGTGWGSDWVDVQVSPLRSTGILIAVRDESTSHLLIGFADQLRPLAEHLNDTTDLGTRQANYYPALSGVDAILTRNLVPLATHYLQQLTSLGRPRPALAAQLAADLDLLCDPSSVIHSSQLVLGGIQTRRSMTHKGVTIRPLSPSERGRVLELQSAWMDSLDDTGDFIVPRRFESFAPTVLLDARTTRQREQPQDESAIAYRLALSLFLTGFDISGSGILVHFDLPRWAAIGFAMGHHPFPVSERFSQDRLVSPGEFRTVVDLAQRIPKFGGTEGTGHDIVLSRVLRGFGMGRQEFGFLDFAIALEAALLGGIKEELAHRFSLYGALYLRGNRDPLATFAQLKNIYAVRSKLVHGSHVSPEARAEAERDAADLARAVTKKAVLDGWPDPKALDEAALRSEFGIAQIGASSLS